MAARADERTAARTKAGLEVCVLGTFRFWADGKALPAVLGGSQRLLALLGLRDRALMRASVAGTLWPDASEDHAYSSLRSALGRLSRLTRDAVVVTPLDLALASDVRVDIRDARALAHRLLAAGSVPAADLGANAIETLSVDVLPDWFDDWVLAEAEEWRQLRLHALEALAERLLAEGAFGEATGAALAAIRAEPLRESAHAIVIRVHLAEGNRSEALREFERYRVLLLDELGLEPTPRLHGLIADLR
jgi:DNA-binding SARP family transcriptional activator